MTIETTIRGGLPVCARGIVYPGCDYVEDIELFWLKGGRCHLDLSDEEEDRICGEFVALVRRGDES